MPPSGVNLRLAEGRGAFTIAPIPSSIHQLPTSVELNAQMRKELMSISRNRREMNKSALHLLNQGVREQSGTAPGAARRQQSTTQALQVHQGRRPQTLLSQDRYGEDSQAYAGVEDTGGALGATIKYTHTPEAYPAAYGVSEALPKVMKDNLNS